MDESTEDARLSDRTAWIAFALVALLAAGILSWGIDEPFVRQHESCLSEFSQWARHWVRYGPFRTRMGQILDPGPLEMIERPRYYVHCLPALTGEMALVFSVLGVHEWSARLAPILHSLALLLLTFLCGRLLWGNREGIVASLVLAVMPMFSYYGRIAEYLTAACPLFLLTFVCYIRWLALFTRARTVCLGIACFAASLYSHEGYVFGAVLFLHGALIVKRWRRLLPVIPPALALALGIQIVHLVMLLGWQGMLDDFRDVLERRGPCTVDSFTLTDLSKKEVAWGLRYFGPVPLVLSLVCVAVCLVRRRAADGGSRALLLYACHGVIMVGMWQGLAYNHEYFHYSLVPAIALASGRAITVAQGRLAGSRLRLLRWILPGLVIVLHAGLGVMTLRSIREVDFFTPTYDFAATINRHTRWGEGVMTNHYEDQNQPTFLFYADRHLAYGVGCDTEVQRLLGDSRRNYRMLALWHDDGRTEYVAFPEGLHSFEAWVRTRGQRNP